MKRLLEVLKIEPRYTVFYRTAQDHPWMITHKQFYTLRGAKEFWAEIMLNGYIYGRRVHEVSIKDWNSTGFIDIRRAR